jgi:hypothetical protein
MKLLCALCFLCATAANCVALDREAFTFTHYNLDLRLEPEQQRMGVRGKITLRNDSSSPQKNAVLQISSSLAWRSIQIGAKPVQYVTQPYESDIDHTGELSEAIVTLPREIAPKSEVEVEIGYEGVIPLDTARLTRIGVPKEVAAHTDWDQISASFTTVRGVGHVVWYPVAMEAASLSEGGELFERMGRWRTREEQSEVKINIRYAPPGAVRTPTLFCSGKGNVLYEEMGQAQLITAECSFQPPGLNEPFFLLGNYATLNRSAVNIHYLGGHESAAENFGLASDLAAPFVSEWFGTPKTKVEIFDLTDPSSAPFESDTTWLTPLVNSDSRTVQTGLIHSLTHAAFPSMRLWIFEGVAHFAQALHIERQDGRRSALDYLGSFLAQVQQAEKKLPEAAAPNAAQASVSQSLPATGHALVSSSDPVFYRSKAAYVWWMLRDLVGDDALKKTFAAYHADQDNDPSYMPKLIQAQTKRDLGWFFDDWVYHNRGLPDFLVASVYSTKSGQGYLVTVTVENSGAAGAEMPVTLKFVGGQVTQRLEVRGKASASVRFTVSGAAQEVEVNDGSVPEADMTNNVYTVDAPAPKP